MFPPSSEPLIMIDAHNSVVVLPSFCLVLASLPQKAVSENVGEKKKKTLEPIQLFNTSYTQKTINHQTSPDFIRTKWRYFKTTYLY